ncbi:MAG: winged helix-turn-helix domain-containing protein [Streptosporangiaceae bacterium]
MTATEVPQYHELLWPALQAVAELGGSASIGEIVETVIKREGFTDNQQAVLHNDGPETEIGYRLAWARTYLKASCGRRARRSSPGTLSRIPLNSPKNAAGKSSCSTS